MKVVSIFPLFSFPCAGNHTGCVSSNGMSLKSLPDRIGIAMPEKRDGFDRLRIASPCQTSWEQMRGDDRARFCESCNLHVYNISELTRKQAEALIASTEGRICARMYRRADGTVLTKDCPVGLRALRRRASKVAGAAVTALFSLCMSVIGQQASQTDKQSVSGVPVKTQAAGSNSQANQGRLVGVIKDPNGAAVGGATVSATNGQTGQKWETLTNDEGLYQFSSLEAGSYTVVVVAPGFQISSVAVTVRGGVVNDGSVALGVDVGRGEIVGVLVFSEDYDLHDITLGNKTIFPARKITSLPF